MTGILNTEWKTAVERYALALGYSPGERLSTPEQVAAALTAITISHPDTCMLEEYGRSVEGRPLQLLTIASPQNLSRIDAIRRANRSPVEVPDQAKALLADVPATVWVIANVHGDEHSTAEAAVALAAWLAEGSDPVLDEVVVCIDPCQNPDGRARSVNAYYSLFGLKPRRDANAAEHWEPWGSGRGNHYLFDMNRDWFPLTQPESRARVSAFLNWRPQIVADLHEMWWDSRFFFPPPANPMNPNLGEHIIRWWKDLGHEIGSTFDAHGWDYWTGETFDAFYPGYGEAFPSIHGSIGMTFEQASSAGIEIERKDGTLLTFTEAIQHHFAASLTTCRVAASNKRTLLNDTIEYFAGASGLPGPAAYVFPDRVGASGLAKTLCEQGISVEQMAEDAEVRCSPYEGGDAVSTALRKGSIVVRLDQPEGRAVRAVLERETTIDADWLEEQVERVRDHVHSEFYDHTAWSFPLALGLHALTTDSKDLAVEPWQPRDEVLSDAAYGYLLPAEGISSLRTVCGLLGGGIRVHVARKDFSVSGLDFGRGTFVVKRADQPVEWADICAAIGHNAIAVDSAQTVNGIDLGSDHVALVSPPRVAVLFAEPTSSLSYGWIAYLFEQRLELPFTPLRIETLKDTDIRKYDVIVLPNGRKEAYAGALNDDACKGLHEWVRQGGTLVGLGGAAAHIVGKGKEWTTSRVVSDLRDLSPDAKTEKDEVVPLENRPERVPGAALRVALDTHHWATLGYGEESHVLCASDLLLAPSVEGRNVAVYKSGDRLVLGGFVWDKMKAVLPGKAYLIDETLGRGHVLLFAEDPNVRGYWDVTSKLFVNAVLLGPRG